MRRTRRKKVTEAELLERFHCVKQSAGTLEGSEMGLASFVVQVAKALNVPLAGGKALPLFEEGK